MFKLSAVVLFACAAAFAAAGTVRAAETAKPAVAATTASKPVKSGHVPIDGVDYYYEIHGRGKPLLLLHGGLGSIDMFGPALTKLAQSRQVIAVDLQGHGRTALGDRPFRVESIGDDMATLVKRLGHDSVDVLGYSLGGGVALRMAIQQPQSVRRAVFVSAGFSNDGFYPDVRALQVAVSGAMAPQMVETPMYKSYAAVAPKPQDFPKLLDALGELMRGDHDWSADVGKVKAPVMLVYGDGDMYRPEHVIKFYQLLGGGLRDAGWQRENLSQNRLAILPGLTHYDIFMSPRLIATALPFLDGVAETRTWADQVGAAR